LRSSFAVFNDSLSMPMPVGTGLPVVGHAIISIAIVLLLGCFYRAPASVLLCFAAARTIAAMPTDRAILISGAMVAASIVTHAFITQPHVGATTPPARYQLVHLEADGSRVARLDTRTGAIVVCGGAPEMYCGP
jgi:hypothetical protein